MNRTGEIAQKIANALRQEIINGTLAADQPLRQQQIAERFNASRMPVRDALHILEKEGLVTMTLNKGTKVAPLDAESYREIYEMRVAAETLALRLAIPELTNSQLAKAEEILKKSKNLNIENFGQSNLDFHELLYTPCNRPRLLNHISVLNDLSDRYLRIAAKELDYFEKSHHEHQSLLKACRERDEKKACKLLTDHIETAGRLLFNRLKAQ